MQNERLRSKKFKYEQHAFEKKILFRKSVDFPQGAAPDTPQHMITGRLRKHAEIEKEASGLR